MYMYTVHVYVINSTVSLGFYVHPSLDIDIIH